MIPDSLTADELLEAAERLLSRVLQIAVERTAVRANEFSWSWARTTEACFEAFERTGDERFIDWVAYSYEKILEFRDEALGLEDGYRGRITSSWGSGRYMPDTWMTHVTMGGRITYPSLRFAQIVLESQSRFARHVEAAKRYIDIALNVVHEYDEDFVFFEEPGEHYYHMPLKDQVDTINHVNSLVNAHIALWQLAGDTECRDKAIQCCKVFKDSTTSKDGAYSWPLRPWWSKLKNNRRAEPLWKAQVSSATALLAWKAGLYFDRADMDQFAKTISEVLLPGEDDIRDRVSVRHGKTDWAEMDTRYRGRLVNIAGYLPWREIDPSLEQKILHRIHVRNDIFRGPILNSPAAMSGYALSLPPSS